jgi:hypothetical protein
VSAKSGEVGRRGEVGGREKIWGRKEAEKTNNFGQGRMWFGSSPKGLKRPHPQPVHSWLLVHSSLKRDPFELEIGRPREQVPNLKGSLFRPFSYIKTRGDFSFGFPVYIETKTDKM